MGQIRQHYRVLLIAAISSRYPEGIAWAAERAEQTWGKIQFQSPIFEFDQTEYYSKTMGEGIKKQLLAFERLIDPAEIADQKLISNHWEQEFANEFICPEPRPLNIDPGYLTEAKLVLVTTKDRDHRIFLRDGIFAEVTLHYQGKVWNAARWTYPDYLRSEYHDFFSECRGWFRKQLTTVSD